MDEGIHAACKIQRMKFLGACKTCNTDQYEKEEFFVECTFHVWKIKLRFNLQVARPMGLPNRGRWCSASVLLGPPYCDIQATKWQCGLT